MDRVRRNPKTFGRCQLWLSGDDQVSHMLGLKNTGAMVVPADEDIGSAGIFSTKWALLSVKIFAVFLMTLVNFTVFVPVAGAFLLAACRPMESLTLNKRSFFWLVVFMFALTAFGFKFWAYDIEFTGTRAADSFFNNFVSRSVLAGVFVYLKGYTWKHPDEVVLLVRIVLIAHVAIFFFQFSAFYAAGIYIDFFEIFTGTVSRAQNLTGGEGAVIGLGAKRLTGLFAEPSNIASVIFLLSMVSISGRRNERFDWLVLPVAAAMFFSFSTLAAVLSVLLLGFAVFAVSDVRRILVLFFGFGILAVAFAFVFQDEILLQIEKAYDSYGIRLEALVFVFERSGIPLFIGHGPFGVEEELSFKARSVSGAREIASLRDAGLAVFLMLQFGMLGLLFYLLVLFSAGRTFFFFVMMVLATLTKFEFSQVVFLLVVAYVASESRRDLWRKRVNAKAMNERWLE